jgi:AcrR family transcriptional regulator
MTGRKRADGRATMRALLDAAHREVDSHGLINFNLDRVLADAGAARSSLYHHFGSREALLAAVEFESMLTGVRAEMEVMRSVILSAGSIDDVLALFEMGLRGDGGSASRARRIRRIEQLVIASRSTALADVVAKAQRDGTKHLADTLTMAAEKGIISPRIDTMALSMWLQTHLVGRNLLDVLDDPAVEAEWITGVVEAARHLFTGGSSAS